MLPTLSSLIKSVLIFACVVEVSRAADQMFLEQISSEVRRVSPFFGKVLLNADISPEHVRVLQDILVEYYYPITAGDVPKIEERFLKACGKHNMSYIMNAFRYFSYFHRALVHPMACYPCQGLKSYKECTLTVMRNYTSFGFDMEDVDDISPAILLDYFDIYEGPSSDGISYSESE